MKDRNRRHFVTQHMTTVVLVLLALVTLIAVWSPLQAVLEFDQQLVAQGQWWRPFSAWLTQLNLRHWVLNQWGLVVMAVLLPSRLPKAHWSAFAIIWILTSLALWGSEYDRYVGLSGVLYGWLVYAAYVSPFYGRWVKCVFIALMSAKVLSENGWFSLPGADWVGEFIQAQVAHESHLWGLLSGLAVLSAQWIVQRYRGKHEHPDS
ncbi:MAG: rhombosortase [Reinekea sp.]|nr:rhombosortase [Reinekea sp.]